MNSAKVKMDKSVLIQKQVRDNADDMQKELLDMNAWEEQMKRKDFELRNAKEEESLPPIRNKKNMYTGKSVRPVEEEKVAKTKRIKSYDYESWDSFDAVGACKEIENQGEEIELTEEELEEKHKNASKQKDKGNVFVKEKQWAKAISCYTEAIKIFPYDATFYANRGLCHLKLNNIYSSEADCTVAIQMDEMYVKAYYRRAMARIELKQYKEAKQDIEKMLHLEPSNKEAKVMLAKVKKCLDNLQPVVLKNDKEEEDEKEDIPIVVPSAKKLPKKEDKMPEKNTKINVESSKILQSEKKSVPREKEDKKDQSLVWLPALDKFKIVQPVEKSAHLKSQKPLKRIAIKEASFSRSILPKSLRELKNSSNEESTKIKKLELEKKVTLEVANAIEAIEDDFEIPPVPKTSVQFLFNWKKNKSLTFRYKYFKLLSPEELPGLFQNSLESDSLSEILAVLSTVFVAKKEAVFPYLESLSNVKRFRALALFMNKDDKQALEKLFAHCGTVENKSEEEITELRKKYEL